MDKSELHKILVSEKGCALLAAVDSGLLKLEENGDVETTEFTKFWELFTEDVSVRLKVYEQGSVYVPEFLWGIMKAAVCLAVVLVPILTVMLFLK